MQLFEGSHHAKILDDTIRKYLLDQPISKKLAIVQIGENPSSGMYINLKVNKCTELGVPVFVKYFQTGTDESTIIASVKELMNDYSVKSVIVQLPLPSDYSSKILDLLKIDKDVDLLSKESKVKFYSGSSSRLTPVVRSAAYFMNEINFNPKGKKATIVGTGELIGKPLSYYLRSQGCIVEEVSFYKKGTLLKGDLVVLGTGNPRLILGDDINENANVIDFGSSVVSGRAVGDLDMNSKLDHLGHLSPSPGGMGPLVIRFLIMNHLGL
jgi:methylenetetrahydrofolate dehydrogenase (NADP+)/methenyltetrahydrofolate cyclohydrolase